MEIFYHKNYYNSIKNGLENAFFIFNGKEIKGEIFFEEIEKRLKEIKRNKGRIYFLGNGASSAFANHMALDFSKNGKLSSRSLSDSSLITALANDFSYDEIFVEFLKIEKIKKEDFVISISSSGNSNNIVNSLNYCSFKGIKTFSLSGLNKSNESVKNSNYSIFIPLKTYGMVECIHQIFLHLILDKFMGVKEWERVDSQNMNHKSFKI